MATPTNLERFTELLRELFQFDVADLDFGVYRILNEKREDIARFIENDLAEGVQKELEAFEEGQRETEEVRHEFADQIIEASPFSVGSRYLRVWSIFGHSFRGETNISSKLKYLVRVGRPISERSNLEIA